MQLGETIATYDVALALRGESGKFDVTSPTGELYHITCTPNHSITNLQCSANGATPQPFLIRKVAEPIPAAPERSGPLLTDVATPRAVKTPFLISTHDDDSRSEERPTSAAASAVAEPGSETKEIASLQLVYVEADPQTRQPTAWVCLRIESEQPNGIRITNACVTFNELDAEIRRRHAQLDDIRYRARKKFYEAHAMAAGA